MNSLGNAHKFKILENLSQCYHCLYGIALSSYFVQFKRHVRASDHLTLHSKSAAAQGEVTSFLPNVMIVKW
jgi:hypothetical protein